MEIEYNGERDCCCGKRRVEGNGRITDGWEGEEKGGERGRDGVIQICNRIVLLEGSGSLAQLRDQFQELE